MTDTPTPEPTTGTPAATASVAAPTTPAATSPSEPAPADAAAVDDPRLAGARQEAARYRTRLREAENQLEQRTAALTAMQRAEVERLATSTDGSRARDTSDLWRAGVDLEQVIGDDGAIDATKLTAAVDAAQAAHPHWFENPVAARERAYLEAAQRTGTSLSPAGARPRPVAEQPKGLGQLIAARQRGDR